MEEKNKQKQAAAKARADALSPADRSAIARQAAGRRWAREHGLPEAQFASGESPLMIGGIQIDCYVLDDGRRVLTQESFLTSIGRAAKAKGGQGVRTAVDKLPPFLAASNLQPFVEQELSQSTTPIEFMTPSGTRVLGYPAEMLPEVCRVYLSARDAGALLPSQKHIAERADMLVRALASVGIVALVDEATGYQEVRDKKALAALLDKYLRQEFAKWAKRFPDAFYREMFRLRDWAYPTVSGGKPGVVGKYTMDIVYDRLAPGLVQELETRNPKNEAGRRAAKHHQWLSEDVGHPALSEHIHAVTGLMRACDNWTQFMNMLDRAFPRKGDSLRLEGFE
ncbi:P63C domain-containing protein [Paraburkholderia sp. RL17-347-BIC-D]|uniref:P63C domain-containing protein n=1 Tax=Paraburkholderia sp. RL17-347-BIC-D TaxID=3031632 RepID=UPI0038B750ED